MANLRPDIHLQGGKEGITSIPPGGPDCIPGSNLIIVDGVGGLLYFCRDCKSTTEPVDIWIAGRTVPVCEQCFLEETCQDESQFEGEACL